MAPINLIILSALQISIVYAAPYSQQISQAAPSLVKQPCRGNTTDFIKRTTIPSDNDSPTETNTAPPLTNFFTGHGTKVTTKTTTSPSNWPKPNKWTNATGTPSFDECSEAIEMASRSHMLHSSETPPQKASGLSAGVKTPCTCAKSLTLRKGTPDFLRPSSQGGTSSMQSSHMSSVSQLSSLEVLTSKMSAGAAKNHSTSQICRPASVAAVPTTMTTVASSSAEGTAISEARSIGSLDTSSQSSNGVEPDGVGVSSAPFALQSENNGSASPATLTLTHVEATTTLTETTIITLKSTLGTLESQTVQISSVSPATTGVSLPITLKMLIICRSSISESHTVD